jgi:hypothetical protein
MAHWRTLRQEKEKGVAVPTRLRPGTGRAGERAGCVSPTDTRPFRSGFRSSKKMPGRIWGAGPAKSGDHSSPKGTARAGHFGRATNRSAEPGRVD